MKRFSPQAMRCLAARLATGIGVQPDVGEARQDVFRAVEIMPFHAALLAYFGRTHLEQKVMERIEHEGVPLYKIRFIPKIREIG